MKTIRILAFRGTSEKYAFILDPRDSPLLQAGHVGHEFLPDQPGIIYGFHPPESAIRKAGTLEALLVKLYHHQIVDGTLQDDTSTFHRAYELTHQGRPESMGTRLVVYYLDIHLDNNQYDHIYADYMTCYNQDKVLPYGFSPVEEDSDFDNCATVQRRFGLPIIQFDWHKGEMRYYIKIFQEYGHPWEPSSK